MESHSSLSELLHSLDATTYFFVSSALFAGIVALVFFLLGLWFGGLLWRPYKRRYRAAEATIDSLKHEAAQLKRRIAGQTARSQAASLPSPASETAFMPVEAGQEETPLVFPPGRPFTLWALPEEAVLALPLPSRAFTVWTEPATPKAVRIADFLPSGSEPPSAPFTAPLLFPSEPPTHLPSQAFSIWTEEDWVPTPVRPLLFSRSAAFTLWTSGDFQPAPVPHVWPPGAAFTLWTRSDFAPAPAPAAVLPPSPGALMAAAASAVRSMAGRSHPLELKTTVAFPAAPLVSSSRSRAFTLWTLPSSNQPPTGISQRTALASLIRSRVETPPLPPLPPLEVEPLPFVPAAELGPRAQ